MWHLLGSHRHDFSGLRKQWWLWSFPLIVNHTASVVIMPLFESCVWNILCLFKRVSCMNPSAQQACKQNITLYYNNNNNNSTENHLKSSHWLQWKKFMISWVMDWVKVGCTEKKTHDVLHLGVCGNSRGPAVCCVHESSIKWSVKTQCTMGGHFTSLPGLSVAGWNSK